MLNAGKTLLAVLTACFITSCTAMNPSHVETAESDQVYVDPDLYKVKSDLYPAYRISSNISETPRVSLDNKFYGDSLTSIRTSDVWSVIYSFEGHHYIYSESFQLRQEARNKAQRKLPYNTYIYTLAIDSTGKVVGVIPFKNPAIVRFKSERWIKLNPKFWANSEWESKPVFEIISSTVDVKQP